MLNIYESVEDNKRKSSLVIVLFIVFITFSAYFISRGLAAFYGYESGGLGIAGIALIFSGVLSYASYYYSDRIILTISKARPADRKNQFTFYSVTENLCLASRLPMPKLYVIDDTAMNAFATGRDPNHAVVCATTGILEKLNRTELEGVIGHELSHVGNYDTRLMATVTILVGLVTLLADWLIRANLYGRRSRDSGKELGGIFLVIGFILAALSPIIAQLIQLSISRRREYLADASSIKLTRQPGGLISALKKLGEDHEPLEAANKATAHLYVVNPFHLDRANKTGSEEGRGTLGWFAGLFNTHPPLGERIKALEQMM